MRITFICPVYPPEPAPAGVMAGQLAGRLAVDGHDVTVLTQFPNRPLGRVFAGYRRCLRAVERADQFDVIRCPNWLLDAKRRPWNRLLENVTFGLSSTLNALREGRPDVMLVETWPLFAVQMNLWLACCWKTPVIYYVQDVYPEALEYAGFLRRSGFLASLMRAWDRRLCMSSQRVAVISEGTKHLLCESRNIRADKVVVISNWVDRSLFPPLSTDNGWREEMGISRHTFLVLFAGTLGHVSGAGVLVEVARNLQVHAGILVLCVGEGVLKQKMADAAQRHGLKNIDFRPCQPRDKIAQMHASADLTVLTVQRDYPDASVPSKLITYLAAGRPVVCAAASSSAVAQHVLAARAGVVAEADNAAAIAEAILKVRGDPVGAAAMGDNARKCFLEHFTLERACQQFGELLSGLTAART